MEITHINGKIDSKFLIQMTVLAEILNDWKFKPIFYIIDKKEKRLIFVREEVEYGYEGVITDYGYYLKKLNQFYIAKTFINTKIENYDFTKELPIELLESVLRA